MYIYFDSQGRLKEIITEAPFRQGDSERDKIYVYVDGLGSPSAGWVSYGLPNGTKTEETQFYASGSALLRKVGKELPQTPVRNLRYFSYGHTYEDNTGTHVGYEFYQITVPSEVLSSSQETDDPFVPTENNLVAASVRFVFADESIFKIGDIPFSVETSRGLLTDYEINSSQYNYLVQRMSQMAEKADASKTIYVVSHIGSADLSGIEDGRIIYSKDYETFYERDSSDPSGYKLYEEAGTIDGNVIKMAPAGITVSQAAYDFDDDQIFGCYYGEDLLVSIHADGGYHITALSVRDKAFLECDASGSDTLSDALEGAAKTSLTEHKREVGKFSTDDIQTSGDIAYLDHIPLDRHGGLISGYEFLIIEWEQSFAMLPTPLSPTNKATAIGGLRDRDDRVRPVAVTYTVTGGELDISFEEGFAPPRWGTAYVYCIKL